MLISAGLDVVSISRRLGHSSPTITLNVYAHMFKKTDNAAAAINEAMAKLRSRSGSRSTAITPFVHRPFKLRH
jgi:integrase